MTPVIAMPACAPPMEKSPDLPALSALLQHARRLPDVADWRCGVLSALDLGDEEQNMARMAAHAIQNLQPGTGVCMALPVHVVAGMSRMFLGAPAAFNAEFGAADLHLHAVGSGWLLQAPFAAAANDGSPDSLLGTALAREPAVSAAARSLRRLGAEVEMWLAGLAFNAERESRGEPPINCIWMWGGATAHNTPPSGQVPGALFSNVEPDAWMTGLAAHCRVELQQARSWEEVRDTRDAVVILQPSSHGAVLAHLPVWEPAWFEPARRDMTSGRLASLRLQIGHSGWQLPAPQLTRWMRRRRPWPQMICP
jgi:hypothetical protein